MEKRLALEAISDVSLDEVEDANEILDACYAVGWGMNQ